MISVGEIMSHRNQIKSAQLLRHQAALLPTNASVRICTFIRQPTPRADMRKLKRIDCFDWLTKWAL